MFEKVRLKFDCMKWTFDETRQAFEKAKVTL